MCSATWVDIAVTLPTGPLNVCALQTAPLSSLDIIIIIIIIWTTNCPDSLISM
jgi:hypothetical protein